MTLNEQSNANDLKKRLNIISGTEKLEIESKIDEIRKKWKKIVEETKNDFELASILNLIDFRKEKLISEISEKEISERDKEILITKIYEIRQNLENIKK